MAGVLGTYPAIKIGQSAKEATVSQASIVVGPVPLAKPVEDPGLVKPPVGDDHKLNHPREETVIIKSPAKRAFFAESALPADADIAKDMVNLQVRHYENMGEKELENRIKNSLRWKDKTWEVALRLGFRSESKVPDLLPALIFVESGGNPDEVAGYKSKHEAFRAGDRSSARGLCQVKPETAQEVAGKLGLKLNNESLFNPDINIAIALEHLDRLYKYYPDLGLAFWAYHFGESNVTAAMRVFLSVDKKLLTSGRIDDILKDLDKGTAFLVKKYDLSFVKLITSPEVRRFFGLDKSDVGKEQRLNDTEYYVPRMGAALEFFARG